jgi:RNA polymerase sigma-70 factor, ECF subfamily
MPCIGDKRDTPVHNYPAQPTASDDFVRFMHAYQDMVFSTAARITGNDAHAEDIAQEVFLRAYEHFEQLRGNPAAGGWLKTVARRLTLNHLARYRKRWRFFSELHPEDALDDDEPALDVAAYDCVDADIDADERRERIEQALMQLPERHRVPLVLYHFEDLPYEEIAAVLHVSLAKVKTDIRRGRAALAKKLARAGLKRVDVQSY